MRELTPRKHNLNARAQTIGHARGRRPLPVVDYPEDVQRPRVRADCEQGGSNAERPCPFVSCRHHLALDITRLGGLKINFPDREVEALKETCALDVADRGGAILEEVAAYMNVTRERIRQLQERAIRHIGIADWMRPPW